MRGNEKGRRTDTDGNSASVDRVVTHTLEDDTRLTDGVNDGRKSGFGKNDIGGTTSGIGSTLDGDSDVGTGESGSIVGTVTSHRAQVTECLKTPDDFVLVFGEDSSETIGVENHLVKVGVLSVDGETSGLKNFGGVHVISETETTTSFLCDSELITGDHLDLDSESLSVVDSLLGVVTGRIEDSEETDKFETVTLVVLVVTGDVLGSDSEGTETTHGEFFDVVFELILDFGGLVSGAEFDNDTSHTLGDTLHFAGRFLDVGDFGTFVDGVESLEVYEFDTLASVSNVGNSANDTSARREKRESIH